jgi:hypothetical protein
MVLILTKEFQAPGEASGPPEITFSFLEHEDMNVVTDILPFLRSDQDPDSYLPVPNE